jgi:hypothetical protein
LLEDHLAVSGVPVEKLGQLPKLVGLHHFHRALPLLTVNL